MSRCWQLTLARLKLSQVFCWQTLYFCDIFAYKQAVYRLISALLEVLIMRSFHFKVSLFDLNDKIHRRQFKWAVLIRYRPRRVWNGKTHYQNVPVLCTVPPVLHSGSIMLISAVSMFMLQHVFSCGVLERWAISGGYLWAHYILCVCTTRLNLRKQFYSEVLMCSVFYWLLDMN